ncbi:MAG: cytochrome C [Desulfuromonas sp.]|nr:MAG: cytochrome C [Desulfuromonas sp.]
MAKVLCWLPLLWILIGGVSEAAPAKGLAIDPQTCLECHDVTIDPDGYAASEHARIACTGCHTGLTDLQGHIAGNFDIERVTCVPCHKPESEQHFASAHMLAGIGCADCHTDIHRVRPWGGDKRLAVATCQGCHDGRGYEGSVHGRAVAAGNKDAAACHDCHHLHQVSFIAKLDTKQRRIYHSATCITCHDDEETMVRNDVAPRVVKTFLDSYHGKSYRLGSPEYVAGCFDCHGEHNILPLGNPESSLHPSKRVATCAVCHAKATEHFAEFYSHGDPHDRKNYPILWWTYIGMTGLLLCVFILFWGHSLLWMFRGFVENREKHAALVRGLHTPPQDGHKLYRRFDKKDIILHLVVIISFFGLSCTGLPLLFSNQEWARVMMSFFGGVENAGLIHRIFALVTFAYFAAALLMSFEFLFIRKGIPGNWWQRLWGPDSLMPNWRDCRDVVAMFRWFLFLGPKPSFERWTYWEKFDFLAVFWGMFAIGGSGLILWFPEWFGHWLPGWIFNVATIIHSDEALLATGFIFTVHFFNTHGRPEKFPMDFFIFNGQISREEMLEHHADLWRRYEEQGLCDRFEVHKPSGVLFDFILKGFGFLCLFAGMALAFLMLYAFLW